MNKVNLHKVLAQYDYDFPESLIAQAPAHPRDSAKLLIYNRGTEKISHAIFKDILDYLPKNGVLVLNQTKVVPARLEVTKPTGGKAKLLYIKHDNSRVYALSDKKLEPNSQLLINSKLNFQVITKSDKLYILKPSFPTKSIYAVLEKYGTTPLPPYIKHSPLKGKKLADEYNTVFAKQKGSIAAPTASLHFTKTLLHQIEKAGITIKYVTLHVNLGTFAPLTEEQLQNSKLHSEHYEIPSATAKYLNQAKQEGRPIIAVGTTVVRTLESASDKHSQLVNLSDDTTLFLNETSKLNFVDELITNFHVPKSSLLMLVSAFVGRTKLLQIYKIAINKKYRLFSFGDGMYIKK